MNAQQGRRLQDAVYAPEIFVRAVHPRGGCVKDSGMHRAFGGTKG